MIGVIADDYTGATDAAVAFRRVGLRTLLFFGTPSTSDLPPHDVLVIALKSRMLAAVDAARQSLEALDWLRRGGVEQVYFKFCSTFDSTPRGNIGPVLDALATALAARTVLLTPSSPEHRRTQYQGNLYVDGTLLSESHMRHHPLTPMTDSSLPRLLAAQTDESVGLVDWATVREGVAAVQKALANSEHRYVLADAIEGADIRTLGRAVVTAALVAGAAGLAGGLAEAYAEKHQLPPIEEDSHPAAGPAAVLSGSCSARTLEQLAVLTGRGRPAYRLDPLAPTDLAAAALAWYDKLPAGDAPVIYSSAPPEQLRDIQRAIGADRAAAILEEATGRIAVGLVDRGVRRLVAAGGETSGAVVTALGIDGAALGPEAARGVPWLYPVSGRPSALLLKSGNFGGPDLLATASA